MCVEYRKLKQMSVSDSYPIPRMDDTFKNAKGTIFMSTVDFHYEFYQVRHAE